MILSISYIVKQKYYLHLGACFVFSKDTHLKPFNFGLIRAQQV